MRLAALVPGLIVCATLAGCAQGSTNTDSAKDFSGDQKAVAETVEDLQSAAKDRKGTTICADLITAQLRDKISATDCPDRVKDEIRNTDEVDLIVKSVTVTDGTAVAQVEEETSDDKRRKRTIEFEKAAGRWRISALPPAQQ